jgi:hypothetical protein
MSHPNSLDLEAFACGETAPAVASHLDGCAQCAAFVDRLRTVVAKGPSRPARPARLPVAPPRAPVRRLYAIVSVIVPLAAAAALLLVLRRPAPPGDLPQPVENPLAVATSETPSDVTFKGGLQTAVIRERGAEQSRFTGSVAVRAGDRLRLEVALDHEQPILGAVLGDDGSWLELMPESVRPPGTHFSERSARVDASPLRGMILVGAPDAVKNARQTKRWDGVVAIHIDWEPQGGAR